MHQKKVLVAMSGGLDSSVVCILLQNHGYKVQGVTLKIYDPDDLPPGMRKNSIGGDKEIEDAQEVAEKLGIKHHVLDVREDFSNTVISNFLGEYMNGRTPNPCTLCNKTIKWSAVLNKADELSIPNIATGHYSFIDFSDGRYYVRKGDDPLKEQSYMLWQLGQNELSRTIFPLGGLTKSEAREIAIKHGLKTVAGKGESFDICFVTDKDYRSYLRRKVDGLTDKYRGGNFVDRDGKFLGHHDGFMFFTIGQRRGLPAMGYRAYVNEIRPETNEVVIGMEEELFHSVVHIDSINAMKYNKIPENTYLNVKLRYHHKGDNAKFHYTSPDSGILEFEKPVISPTPGQSAVFYENNDLLGGGLITTVL